jgi:hypothetical protein
MLEILPAARFGLILSVLTMLKRRAERKRTLFALNPSFELSELE